MNTTTSPISVKLARKVAAKNKLNTAVNELMQVASDYFKPYVGKKIVTTTGDFIKKIYDSIPKKHHSGGANYEEPYFYVTTSRYSLILKVYVAYYTDDSQSRNDTLTDEVYIGEMDEGKLLMMNHLGVRQRKTDYNADDIMEFRNQLKVARLVTQTLESKLDGFGEYDR